MKECMAHVDKQDAKIDAKVDMDALDELLDPKLDTHQFYKVFPQNKEPKEVLRVMIKGETDSFNESVLNMIKLWDQKICNLRSELNIESVYRKLRTLCKKEDLDKMIDELKQADTNLDSSIKGLK